VGQVANLPLAEEALSMRFVNHNGRRLATVVVLTLLLGTAGCGNGQPQVTGLVLFEDGSPLDQGMVVCEMRDGSRPVMARGALARDGTFRLGTKQPGDGAPPGKYRVLVVPRSLNEFERQSMPPIIDPRFEKFETSGIVFDVKEGDNELKITVTKPKAGPR
jgi:hypothetical protein